MMGSSVHRWHVADQGSTWLLPLIIGVNLRGYLNDPVRTSREEIVDHLSPQCTCDRGIELHSSLMCRSDEPFASASLDGYFLRSPRLMVARVKHSHLSFTLCLMIACSSVSRGPSPSIFNLNQTSLRRHVSLTEPD
jgi:hypothetical protein